MMKIAKSFYTVVFALFLTIAMNAHECRADSLNNYDPPISCSNTSGLDPQTAAFISLQCNVQSQVFPSATDTTLVYEVAEEISQPDSYDLVGAGGQIGKVVVTWCLAPAPVVCSQPVKDVISDVRGTILVGTLVSSDGESFVRGAAWSFINNATNERMHQFVIIGTATQAEVDAYGVQSRLEAGPRFVDSATGASYGMNATLPGNIATSMTYEGDMSSIYCTFEPVPTNRGGQTQAECIKEAFEDYAIEMNGCQNTLALAVSAAFAAYFSAFIVCNLTVVVPILGLAADAFCLIVELATLAAALLLAFGFYAICKGTADANLKARLRRCGVTLVEM